VRDGLALAGTVFGHAVIKNLPVALGDRHFPLICYGKPETLSDFQALPLRE
jgi:hypothetical protein